MKNATNFTLSIIAGIISSAIFTVIMKLIDLSTIISWYPGIIVIMQTITVFITFGICKIGYNKSTNFVDRNNSDQSNKAKIITHTVYRYIWIVIYIGIILIIYSSFNSILMQNRTIFLQYGLQYGIVTHEVKVFLIWVYEYTLAIQFGAMLYNVEKQDKNLIDSIRKCSKKEAAIYAVIMIFFMVLLLI